MQARVPTQADLVLLGGGHAQVQLLKSLAMRPLDGVSVTLVTDVLATPYSGMLPGYVEGLWQADEIHIDLVRLAARAGAQLIHAAAIRLDADSRLLHLAGRPPLRFDILSVNSGAAQATDSLPGAADHAIPVKPIAHFIQHLPETESVAGAIAVIGGGSAGVELALALARRTQGAAVRPDIHLISRSERLVPTLPKRASRLITKALEKAGIHLYLNCPAKAVTAAGLTLEDGRQIQAAHRFLVTETRPPDWLKDSGLALDDRGWLAVGPTLQSLSHERIFAAGDIAGLTGQPREKAGVFAVRAGPVLTRNIRALIAGKPLQNWRAQRHWLGLIGLADGRALAVRGSFVAASPLFWHWKKQIDKRFMQRFADLPEMPVQDHAPLGLLAGQLDQADPVLQAMRCVGCGAKAGPGTLHAALSQATMLARQLGADADFLPDPDRLSDAASLPAPPAGQELVQSVDALIQMVPDAFLFGRIAALHALSDLFVSGAQPAYALAQLQTAFAARPVQENRLVQMLAGAMVELSKAGVLLAGGHTMEGAETSLGLAVTGWKPPAAPAKLPDQAALVLSKPIGSGLLLAAHMRGKLPAPAYAGLLEALLQSNQGAARILAEQGAVRMTDVTGFGLARHGLSLLADTAQAEPEEATHRQIGLALSLAAVPLLEGTDAVLADPDSAPSLAAQNRAGLLLHGAAQDSLRLPLLFDPQTAGGVLALLPPEKAEQAVIQLRAAGFARAAIIGRLQAETPGLTLLSDDAGTITGAFDARAD